MPWRETFTNNFASGYLAGITVGRWWRTLQDNSFAVSPRFIPRAMLVTAGAPMNSFAKFVEDFRYGRRIDDVEVASPLFILGHWRSGTTHLHNLLSQDSRFGTPTFCHTIFPHTFLTTEATSEKLLDFFLPPKRAFDNMQQRSTLAQEDEFAMCTINGLSPYMSWVFPHRAAFYDRFLTFDDATEDEKNRWRDGFQWFLKKLTLKFQRPLLLKSPTHTARVGILRKMFPDAKFVHIHRDPYTVYQSTVRLTERGSLAVKLQTEAIDGWEDRILRQYEEMHAAFFRDTDDLSPDQLCNVRFDDLERDPLGEVRRIYETLSLSSFAESESAMKTYIDSIRGYQRNTFVELPEETREEIRKRCCESFERWGYSA